MNDDDSENNYGIDADADAELASRLHQLRPAIPPPDFLRRMLAAEPSLRAALPEPQCRRRVRSVREWLRRPWPLAYAGLAAGWVMILAFRMLTASLLPPSADHYQIAQSGAETSRTPAFAGNSPISHTFLFARNPGNPEEAWP